MLKSHSLAKDHRLRTAEALEKDLVFDVITARQAQLLGAYARDAPDRARSRAGRSAAAGVVLQLVGLSNPLPATRPPV